jgi:hypothetical protein
MRTKHVLILSAGVLLGLGLVLFIMPDRVLLLLNSSSERTLLAQLLGLTFIGFSLLNWFRRNVVEYKLRPIVLANLALYLLGFVMLLGIYFTMSGTDVVWLTCGFFLLMTVAFSYSYCCLQVWDQLIGKLS